MTRQPSAAAKGTRLSAPAQPGGVRSQDGANSTLARPKCVVPPPSPTIARPARARAARPSRPRVGAPDGYWHVCSKPVLG
eukprot:1475605-Pyramimonas_sp.AAC.1